MAGDEFFKKTPKQSRSRSVVGAVVTALEQLVDRASDVGEISVRTVAERAGVGIGSVYDYFNGQDGVFGDFIDRLTQANFEKLQRVVEETKGEPLDVALRRFFDHAFATYLERPRRTRAAITFIFRLGWMTPVIRERDRFAAVVARRIREDRPELDEALVVQTVRLVLDASMGAVMTELWRPTGDLRQQLLALSDATLERQLGVNLLPRR